MSDEQEKRVRELERQVDNLEQRQFRNKNELMGCLALVGCCHTAGMPCTS